MQRWPECCQSPACSKQGRAVPPMLKTTVSYVHDQQALWCSESGRKFPARAHRQNCRSSCCPAAGERIFKFCPDPHKHFFSAQYLHFKHLWPQICLYVAAAMQPSMQNSLLQRIRIRRRLPATAQHSGGQAPAAESRPNQPLTRILITGGDGPPRRSIVPDQGVHEDGI